MKKRWIYLLTALTLAVGMCIAEPMAGIAAPLEADDEGFVAGSCSLTVYPEDPHKEGADSFGEDLAGADVVVDLYQVARAVKTSGQDTYHYELTGEYASLKLPDSPEEGAQPAASWEETAQQAAAIALDAASPCTPVSGSGESAGTKVGNLAPGLYLLVARGRNLTELADYKIEIEQTDSLTQEESKRIATIADSQQYTYAFLPQLVSLPTKEADANGVINTANPGDWIFEASVNLKPERLDRSPPGMTGMCR